MKIHDRSIADALEQVKGRSGDIITARAAVAEVLQWDNEAPERLEVAIHNMCLHIEMALGKAYTAVLRREYAGIVIEAVGSHDLGWEVAVFLNVSGAPDPEAPKPEPGDEA